LVWAYRGEVPVEFLSDVEAAGYGQFQGVPSQADLDRLFFLDDADLVLISRRRGDHNRLGFASQLVTVRFLGTFLTDPLNVPHAVVEYLAQQIGVDDPSCLKLYDQRSKTRIEHAWEIQRVLGFTDFAGSQDDLAVWIEARCWTTGDGPKIVFREAIEWLCGRRVLLPGVSVLARLVASVREAATARLWETVAGALTLVERSKLDDLLVVRDGERVCDLERLRKGPSTTSGPSMVRALERVFEVSQLPMPSVRDVPPRRLVELSRYGLAGKPSSLSRHQPARRHATLVASVRFLEGKAIDDALELLEVLVSNELIGTAVKAVDTEILRSHQRLTDAAVSLRIAMQVVIDNVNRPDQPTLDELWDLIEHAVPPDVLDAAVATVDELAPGGVDQKRDWRAALAARRIVTVSGFIATITKIIKFEAGSDSRPVLEAMETLPAILAQRAPLTISDIDPAVVPTRWKPVVFSGPGPDGINKNAYIFCVLVEFQRGLKRRGIYAPSSTRWTDPRASLLDGEQWAENSTAVLAALSLPQDAAGLVADHEAALDAGYRRVATHLKASGTDLHVDDDGRLHVAALKALGEPVSLVELRGAVAHKLPRIDLSQLVLEAMTWEPEFVAAFESWSTGDARLEGLDVSVAACLAAQAMNIGYGPVVNKTDPALRRDRLSHVAQTYMNAENMARANRPLIERQATIDFAHVIGGGQVAAVDGMRFVVPVKSIYARPNRRYFDRRKGVTWLNMINDHAMGLGARVVSGTVRDSLHVIDVIHNQDGGQRPDIIVTDTASYSDLVFGLLQLLDYSYRPELADMPDQKMWSTTRPPAAYGPLSTAARGRISTRKIEQHWPDILRVVGSIHTGAVRAYDIVRMLQRDGRPTALGEAIASYGRIFKSLHMLDYLDDETYRREIKTVRNLQEGRHALAQRIFHGKKGELHQRYHEGMEDQLGALGLVVNCVVLWNTFYIDLAIKELRQEGHNIRDEDAARLSPYVRAHVNVHGTYSFARPATSTQPRRLNPTK